ncbi:ATP-binding protein [Mucilaginibacter sp.]|uniref:HD domain-containing protein n=1 Tax=Mucilaginibacter sp. TaxID=1882438 RepID=UPI0025E696C7|nr:ATP-binding protein [Mucilaginibacter sp.]
MTVKEKLKELSDKACDDVKIELKLYNLVDSLEKKARNHLKRIGTILTEFDIHDEKHSEKVILNIEQLLGDEVIKKLSCYELFLLQLSAFFHDCAMAPSDWELNTLKLTEGNEQFFLSAKSIKHDLKPTLKLSEAINLVNERKGELYDKFNGDVKKWLFSPDTESQLLEYLGVLLIDYQNHRNGFADQLKKIDNLEQFDKLNDFIRIDFIRITHHSRIEKYIKNLEADFAISFEQPNWGKKLAHDLALICRSHGEDTSYINDFSKNAQYYGSQGANLQFVAIMLRLGDVIHFSFDRAPIDLRSSRIFQSEYSFQQWAIKNSGVNYSIENGLISFRAYCDAPDTYFKLHQYIDWIEVEIQNYFKFQRQWDKSYIPKLQDKVDRTNINNDKDSFFPKRGLSFSLNQNKIIELLMGIGLYKDRLACLRELYQNSLDACRCMLSQNLLSGASVNGKIVFGIVKEEEESYLFCLDNGIGMTKEVIEKFLLKIGNSYYKSSDFFKQQANWGGKFTPTSQFGIGILSCFMIGDRIEITTKTTNSDYVSCCIDGPHENFYYKNSLPIEKEKILASGTIIKVKLNPTFDDLLNTCPIEKIGLLLLGIQSNLPDQYQHYLLLKKQFENHLYSKLNHFVQIVPENITVGVQMNDLTILEIISKPLLIDPANTDLKLTDEDLELVDYQNNFHRSYPLRQKIAQAVEFLDNYRVEVSKNGVEFILILTLPKKSFHFDNVKDLYAYPKVGSNGISIDGISLDRGNAVSIQDYYSSALIQIGVLNYTGELRPQLSVDRTAIVNYPKECEQIAEDITKLLLEKILSVTQEHIERYKFKIDSSEFNLIWEYVFQRVDFADNLFINELAATKYGGIFWKGLAMAVDKQISINEFLLSKEVTIKNWYLFQLDTLTKKPILTKLISADNIQLDEVALTLKSEAVLKNNIIKRRRSFEEYDMLIRADNWNVANPDFDIISNLYPVIPGKLFDKIWAPGKQTIKNKIKIIHAYSNGLNAFFDQSPLSTHETLGLYVSERGGFSEKKINQIYNFSTKRAPIVLFDINDRFIKKNGVSPEYILFVFVAPRILTEAEIKELAKYEEKDPQYVKGVKEGWSLLVTGKDIDNVVIMAGKYTRKELVEKLSAEFWETYANNIFIFTDECVMVRN